MHHPMHLLKAVNQDLVVLAEDVYEHGERHPDLAIPVAIGDAEADFGVTEVLCSCLLLG
jgi:hypothetical protein